MAFEVEQFGIKVILIEPGVIKTNFGNSFKVGKRVTGNNSSNAKNNNPNLPYSEITRKRIAGFKPRFESGSPPIEVAKTILKAITSKNPDLRYLVGDDAFKLMDIKKNISDKDFRKLVMESVIHYKEKKTTTTTKATIVSLLSLLLF
jgi:hypothetical protein